MDKGIASLVIGGILLLCGITLALSVEIKSLAGLVEVLMLGGGFWALGFSAGYGSAKREEAVVENAVKGKEG